MVLWSTQIREGKMMRKSVWMALAVSAALLLGVPASFAGEHKISGNFLMGTGSATGNYYAFGSALAHINIQQTQNSRPLAGSFFVLFAPTALNFFFIHHLYFSKKLALKTMLQ